MSTIHNNSAGVNKMKKSLISLHFDGEIVTDHSVSARTLGKALVHTQAAIDRAYIELKRGNLWKYARMKAEDYREADFIALYPQEGGFIQKLLSERGVQIVDRIAEALTPAFEVSKKKGLTEAGTIASQMENRKVQVEKGLIKPKKYEEYLKDPKVVRKYGDRTINREFDQMLAMIRAEAAGKSRLEIEIRGTETNKYDFDREKSERFHLLVSKRELGAPVVYHGYVTRLDLVILKGKVKNSETNLESTIHFASEKDFLKAHPFLGNKREMAFIGSPLIEYGAFDPKAGDIFFIDLV